MGLKRYFATKNITIAPIATNQKKTDNINRIKRPSFLLFRQNGKSKNIVKGNISEAINKKKVCINFLNLTYG